MPGLNAKLGAGSYAAIETGVPFDPAAFRASADWLFGFRDLQRVDYVMRDLRDGAADLELRVQPRAWGVSTLRMGLDVEQCVNALVGTDGYRRHSRQCPEAGEVVGCKRLFEEQQPGFPRGLDIVPRRFAREAAVGIGT